MLYYFLEFNKTEWSAKQDYHSAIHVLAHFFWIFFVASFFNERIYNVWILGHIVPYVVLFVWLLYYRIGKSALGKVSNNMMLSFSMLLTFFFCSNLGACQI